MEKLIKRYEMAQKTLISLEMALEDIKDTSSERRYMSNRDSLIQRFEYSIDTLWKLIKVYLQEKNVVTLETGSPRTILREAHNVGLMNTTELEILMDCLDDRNLTSHSYNEELAEEVTHRIPEYYLVIKKVFNNIKI